MATSAPPTDYKPPRGWTNRAQSALINALSVASIALRQSYAKAASNRNRSVRTPVKIDQLEVEVALLE